MAKTKPAQEIPGSGINGANIRAALADYCGALAGGSQFLKASEQVDTFIADDAAREAYVRWSHLQTQLDERRRRGFELTAGEVHTYESARRAALGNPVVAEYLAATETLESIKAATLEWLNKTFELKRSPVDADWKAEAKLRAKETKDA